MRDYTANGLVAIVHLKHGAGGIGQGEIPKTPEQEENIKKAGISNARGMPYDARQES